MTVYSVKGKVATEPFQDTSVKTSLNGEGSVRVARIENKVSLVPLAVVFDSEDGRWKAGDVVYVKGNLFTQMWAKEFFKTPEDKTFILMPDGCVETFSRV